MGRTRKVGARRRADGKVYSHHSTIEIQAVGMAAKLRAAAESIADEVSPLMRLHASGYLTIEQVWAGARAASLWSQEASVRSIPLGSPGGSILQSIMKPGAEPEAELPPAPHEMTAEDIDRIKRDHALAYAAVRDMFLVEDGFALRGRDALRDIEAVLLHGEAPDNRRAFRAALQVLADLWKMQEKPRQIRVAIEGEEVRRRKRRRTSRPISPREAVAETRN